MTPLDWLLDADPAIRWQVLRDLAGAPPDVVASERARMATEGWAARLLALRGEDGPWAGGALFPARGVNGGPDDPSGHAKGQPWTGIQSRGAARLRGRPGVGAGAPDGGAGS